MKIKSVFLAIVILLAITATTAYAAYSSWNGSWRSIDIDGSKQQMNIGAGKQGVYKIKYLDHNATFCGGRIMRGKGTGTVGGDGKLHTDIDMVCIGKPRTTVNDVDYMLVYNATTDTLTDQWGVVWHRTRKNP